MIMAARRSRKSASATDGRLHFIMWVFAACACVIIIRLATLQILDYGLYSLYASDQHDLEAKLLPTRGQIFLRDDADGQLHPLATNRIAWQIYVVPKEMPDPVSVAHALATGLQMPDVDMVAKLTKKPDDPYEAIAKDVDPTLVAALKAQNLPGVGFVQLSARLYPEKGLGGQLIGFVSPDDNGNPVGHYGVEGSLNSILAGTPGTLSAEKDASGHQLIIGQTDLQGAVNGSDVVLTIDRTIQYEACALIQQAVAAHQADQGSILIMDPQTGAIMAMCSSPDFDPSNYGKVSDLSVLNNPVTFGSYEPGSIFKAFTLSAGLDAGKITPNSTYVDKGVVEIDNFKIHDADLQTHGVETMTTVLDQSYNLGTIFVEQQLGPDVFRKYVQAFGFGVKTGVGLTPEAKGDISSLSKKGDIFAATGSFGQGISVTPVQLVAAYGALANGGKLMQPYIVDEIIHPDGTREKTKPQVIGQPITSRTASLITGMLTSVVENGLGKRAAVPGYYVAGKTGTAQVASSNGTGYLKDVTIGSFAGYAPATDPKFVMLVKIDHPRDVQWAESSAAPLFGQMAQFLLSYLQVPPERPITAPPPAPILFTHSSSTSATSTPSSPEPAP
ncbi:MAG: penicillin-binding protein 2 [Patescibacteria group bacterium]